MFFPGMFQQPQANPWQQVFLQFLMYLQQSQILFDSFNFQMQFNCFQQFIISIASPLAFQPVQMQTQVFQQFLMWRQSQIQPPPSPSPNNIPIPTPTPSNSQNNNNGVLPRDKITDSMEVGSGGSIINVTLNASTGHKVVIKAGSDTTIDELLKSYMRRMGLSQESIGKDIMFMYNGAKLLPDNKAKICTIFRNAATITVYDIKGIIGALN